MIFLLPELHNLILTDIFASIFAEPVLHGGVEGFIFLKAFIGALFLTFRNLVNFNYSQRQGNDRCLWCVFIHLVTIGEVSNIVAFCVFYIIA